MILMDHSGFYRKVADNDLEVAGTHLKRNDQMKVAGNDDLEERKNSLNNFPFVNRQHLMQHNFCTKNKINNSL